MTQKNKHILVAGAGGFIGGWLVKSLLDQGFTNIRSVDIKPLKDWYQTFKQTENLVLDLKDPKAAEIACKGIQEVYNLAADMGGMGFIENNKALCMLSVLINTNLLVESTKNNVKKYFFASSACVYNQDKQLTTKNLGLKEADAYPGMPEDGYGWEKLFSERMCRHFSEDFGLQVRIARFHNVYGPHGTYDGGREKAPAAICRKVAEAVISGNHEIDIWGDGEQTRSFTYIDDTILGIHKLMESDFQDPINLGSDQLVSINELVTIVENIAGVKLERNYQLDAPKGVRGRNSDNTLIRKVLDWAPQITLETGLDKNFNWIKGRIKEDRNSFRSD
jgi:nucleoside-diphosphate-sugar epimerase